MSVNHHDCGYSYIGPYKINTRGITNAKGKKVSGSFGTLCDGTNLNTNMEVIAKSITLSTDHEYNARVKAARIYIDTIKGVTGHMNILNVIYDCQDYDDDGGTVREIWIISEKCVFGNLND